VFLVTGKFLHTEVGRGLDSVIVVVVRECDTPPLLVLATAFFSAGAGLAPPITRPGVGSLLLEEGACPFPGSRQCGHGAAFSSEVVAFLIRRHSLPRRSNLIAGRGRDNTVVEEGFWVAKASSSFGPWRGSA